MKEEIRNKEKMRILHITPQTPGMKSGGEIGVGQTLLSLYGNGYIVDYVGPKICNKDLIELYNNVYELEPISNNIIRMFDSLRGYTNSRYRAWKKLVAGTLYKEFDIEVYDAVVMDFTKLDYVAEDLHDKRLIVRVHNVEADYFDREFEHAKSIKSFILKITAKKREEKVIKKAEKLIVLTDKDKDRIMELYKTKKEKFYRIPVCLQEKKSSKFINIKKENESLVGTNNVNMLITGSLWFGPNYDGIKWFIQNCYSKIKVKTHLVIAGYKPNPELKELANIYDIDVIDSPIDMEPYFKAADIAIAPVFDGAGMKVKVAEALSYGLPVVGTTHAFTGYDIVEGKNSWRTNTEQGFIDAIVTFSNMSEENKKNMGKEAYRLYETKYSQNVSTQMMKNIIENI